MPRKLARLGVFLLDRSEGRGSGEHRHRAVFLDDPPEGARVGRADRLALVEDRRGAGEQRRIDDVGVPDDPADVGGGEHRLARLDVVDIAHRPAQRDGVAAVVAVDALGLSGGPGRVEDVERVGRCDLDAVGPGVTGRRRDELAPVDVALTQLGGHCLALQHHDLVGLVLRARDPLVEEGLVGHDAPRLDAARRAEDELGFGVVDAGLHLGRREAAEDHRVDRPDARAREHGEDRLGDHRHVDEHPVALADSCARQRPGEPAHLTQHLGIREGALGARHRRVVVDGDLIGTTPRDVSIKSVETRVERAVGEPPIERRVGVIEDLRRRRDPVDVLGGGTPEALGVADAGVVTAAVGTGLLSHGRQPAPRCRPLATGATRITRDPAPGPRPPAPNGRPPACHLAGSLRGDRPARGAA